MKKLIRETWDMNPDLVVGIAIILVVALVCFGISQRRRAKKELNGDYDS